MKQKTSKGTLSPRKTRTTMTTSTDRHQGVHPSRRRTRQADKRRRRIRELFADPSPKVWATVCPARTTAPTAPNLHPGVHPSHIPAPASMDERRRRIREFFADLTPKEWETSLSMTIAVRERLIWDYDLAKARGQPREVLDDLAREVLSADLEVSVTRLLIDRWNSDFRW